MRPDSTSMVPYCPPEASTTAFFAPYQPMLAASGVSFQPAASLYQQKMIAGNSRICDDVSSSAHIKLLSLNILSHGKNELQIHCY